MRASVILPTILTFALLAPAATAQTAPIPEDVASPEAIVAATYASIQRAPGEPFDWDRFRSLFLPGALLIPNTEQTGGESRVMSPEDFIAWIEGWYAANAPIGSDADLGFQEEEIGRTIERYGDVAQVMSAYRKHYWEDDEELGQGINSYQLVRLRDRWWIVSLIWDEDYAAGPVPERYRPGR